MTKIYSIESVLHYARLFSTYQGMLDYIKDCYPIGTNNITARVYVLNDELTEYDSLPLIWRLTFRISSKGEVIETSRL